MNSGQLTFKHPEPERSRISLYPVFIPFAGCPYRCIYCSQQKQTGKAMAPSKLIAQELHASISAGFANKRGQVSLGFFGGTFTAMPAEDQRILLDTARHLKEIGAVEHIRCSTRPDCIDERTVDFLTDFQVDMVELGIQSFDDRVLALSGRGYTGRQAHMAAATIQKNSLGLGIQLMPGLPGSNTSTFFRDIEITASLRPAGVRIYPCLVLKNTPLALLWSRQKYRPWSLDKTLNVVSHAFLRLWRMDIPVIRAGLAPEGALLPQITAGPWHPALGSLCRGRALAYYVLNLLNSTDARIRMIYVPHKYQGDFWGHRKENAPLYLKKGIGREKVEIWQSHLFRLVWQPVSFPSSQAAGPAPGKQSW